VRISVKDSGQGIDESKLIQLFEPFNRLGAEKSGVEGTGIGLCIAKNLVERMGGKIGVMNNKDKGCCFWVEFPIALQKITPEQHATETNKKLHNELDHLQKSLTDIGLIKNKELASNMSALTDNISNTIKKTTLH
jgi:hypothetical protein